ncbi:MAG TPA: spermidine/putrescine ABC transporter substrate-binding protein, partial [Actinomycetota bacterium]|nr:spermidine/putrescine ABC transporter substrate-binding protein [Actinomycetota bacterium]
YIDIDEEDGSYPSIVAFTDQTGIEVNYTEAIQDNAEFMGTILPDLQAGNPTGWDVITPGGWVVERLARLDLLEELDHSQLPNWTANAADYAKGLWFDPDNRYSLWWQGGITGIAYDPELTGREITTFDDLLDPAFAGVAGAFSDMRDMFGLTLLSLGVEPANATVDDVTRARDKLLEANERNQFRGYYGNEYYDALSAGDLAIAVAWSGDITQMQLNDNDKVQFVIPADGAMRWNDNFAIPKRAARIGGAHQLLNYYYGVPGATLVSEYIGYFTGVNGVQEQILADVEAYRAEGDTENADYYEAVAPTVVPTDDQLANTFSDKELTEEEEAEWNDLWLEVSS